MLHRSGARDGSFTHNHLVNEDAQCPPIDSRRVAIPVHDLGSDVLCRRARQVPKCVRSIVSKYAIATRTSARLKK